MGYLLDRFPIASAAFSLRKLNSSYSGPALRVAVDYVNPLGGPTTSTDITFDTDGYINKGEILNLMSLNPSATTCYVIEWYDQSGNEKHLIRVATGPNFTAAEGDPIPPIIYENGQFITGVDGNIGLKFTNNYLQGLTADFTVGTSSSEFSLFGVISYKENHPVGNVKEIVKLPEATFFRQDNNTIVYRGVTDFGTEIPGGYIANKEMAVFAGREFYGSATYANFLSVNGNRAGSNSVTAVNTTTSKISIGKTEGGNETTAFVGNIYELIYYRNFSLKDKHEIEADMDCVYNCISRKRSKLDTISDSYEPPSIGYSLRAISSHKIHPTPVQNTFTGDELAAIGIFPLIEVRRSSDNARVNVYPDNNGEISLNSRVVVTSGTVTFPKLTPYQTFGEFLGNPKYSNEGAAHSNGFVRTWYEQSTYNDSALTVSGSSINVSSNSVQVGHLKQITNDFQPRIYNTATGIEKLNGKPTLLFTGDDFLQANITSGFLGGNFNIGGTSVLNGFLTTLVGGVSSTTENEEFVKIINTSDSNKTILEIRRTTSDGKIKSSIYANTTETSDTSSNVINSNTQYIISTAKRGTRFYTTANGISDSKTTATGTFNDTLTNHTALLTIGNNLNGYIQEFAYIRRPAEAYKLDIEEEIYRHYKTPSQSNVFLPAIGTTFLNNIKAAYGLRQLANASSSKLIRIRRASDNSEADVRWDFEGKLSYESLVDNGITSQTFINFCKGTTCHVTKIYNQIYSLSTQDLIQTTAGHQPIIFKPSTGFVKENSNPAMEFSNSHMVAQLQSDTVGVVTFAMVSSLKTQTSSIALFGASTLLTSVANNDTFGETIRFGINNTNKYYNSRSAVNAGTDIAITARSAVQDLTVATLSVTSNVGAYASCYNGSDVIVNTNSPVTLAPTVRSISIGGKVTSSTAYPTSISTATNTITGTIQELIIWGNDGYNKSTILDAINDYYKVY